MNSQNIRVEINRLKEQLEVHGGCLGNWIKIVRMERRELKILDQHLAILEGRELPLSEGVCK